MDISNQTIESLIDKLPDEKVRFLYAFLDNLDEEVFTALNGKAKGTTLSDEAFMELLLGYFGGERKEYSYMNFSGAAAQVYDTPAAELKPRCIQVCALMPLSEKMKEALVHFAGEYAARNLKPEIDPSTVRLSHEDVRIQGMMKRGYGEAGKRRGWLEHNVTSEDLRQEVAKNEVNYLGSLILLSAGEHAMDPVRLLDSTFSRLLLEESYHKAELPDDKIAEGIGAVENIYRSASRGMASGKVQ